MIGICVSTITIVLGSLGIANSIHSLQISSHITYVRKVAGIRQNMIIIRYMQ